jgi:hypothetical protein
MLCTCVGTAAVVHVSRTGWEALKCSHNLNMADRSGDSRLFDGTLSAV